MRLCVSLVGLLVANAIHVLAQSRTSPILTVYPGQDALPTLDEIHTANVTAANFLPLENIQADIFIGMKKSHETFVFVQIVDPSSFKKALKTILPNITSTATILSPPALQPLALLNVAFTHTGLTTLGIKDTLNDPDFTQGQFAGALALGDVLGEWESPFAGTTIHAVFLVASDTQANVNQFLAILSTTFGNSINTLTSLQGAARPGAEAGHEHFGFLDGISNPAVTGFSTKVLPGQSRIPAGIILAGRPGDTVSRPAWAVDGSFLVFRKLQQLVPEFNAFVTKNALPGAPDLLAARMVGRWKSGAPVDLAPTGDDQLLGADPQRNNDFDFSHPGSNLATDQTRCPFGAHIRKVRPRADLGNLDLVNQTFRSSIPFGPELNSSEIATTAQLRGLAFVMYQSTIGAGFGTQQKLWANNPVFPPGKNQTVGIDSIIGQVGGGAPRTILGLDPANPPRSFSIPDFVVPLGGIYAFSPSISAIRDTISAPDVSTN